MPTKQNPGAFDCYKAALPDEPIFVILGRDPAGPATLEHWAHQRIKEGKTRSDDDNARIKAALDEAVEMVIWRNRMVDASVDGVAPWRLPMNFVTDDTNPVHIGYDQKGELEIISTSLMQTVERIREFAGKLTSDTFTHNTPRELAELILQGSDSVAGNAARLEALRDVITVPKGDPEIDFAQKRKPTFEKPVLLEMTDTTMIDISGHGSVTLKDLKAKLDRLRDLDERYWGDDENDAGFVVKPLSISRVMELLDYATAYGEFDETTPNGTVPTPASSGSPMSDSRRCRIATLKQVLGGLSSDFTMPPEDPAIVEIGGKSYDAKGLVEGYEFARNMHCLGSYADVFVWVPVDASGRGVERLQSHLEAGKRNDRLPYPWTERLSQVEQRTATEAYILDLASRIDKLGAHTILTDVSTYLFDAAKALGAWNDAGSPGMSGETILPVPDLPQEKKRKVSKSPALGAPYEEDPERVARKRLVDRLDAVIDSLDDDRKPYPAELYRALAKGNGQGWAYAATGFGMSDLIAVRDALLAVDQDLYKGFVQDYLDEAKKIKIDGVPIMPPGEKISLTVPPEVPAHRFAVFHKGEHFAYAKGLEVNPVHLPTALDEMLKSGWNLLSIFGETDTKNVGFIFQRTPYIPSLQMISSALDNKQGEHTIRAILRQKAEQWAMGEGKQDLKKFYTTQLGEPYQPCEDTIGAQKEGEPLPEADRGRGAQP